jgi:hypothetical protein
MNASFLSIVKRIIAEQGEEVLANPQRLKAFFSDLAKDEPKPLRIAFGRCIEVDAYNALKTAPNQSDRADRKAAIAQRLRDEHGLDITLCGEALDILEAVLFADRKGPFRCAKCGGELREEWKLCPFCGTTINTKQVEVPASPPIPHIIPKNSTEEDQIPNNASRAEQTDSGVPGVSIIGGVIIGAFSGIVVGAVGVYADVFYDYAVFICGAVGCVIGGIIGSVIGSQRRKPYITPKSSNFYVGRIIIGGVVGAIVGYIASIAVIHIVDSVVDYFGYYVNTVGAFFISIGFIGAGVVVGVVVSIRRKRSKS